MERNLGLCEGCESWIALKRDIRNGEFNRLCFEAMLEGYKKDINAFDSVEAQYKEQCLQNIVKVYMVARRLTEYSIDYFDPENNGKLDCVGTAYEYNKSTAKHELRYAILKDKDLFFPKEYKHTEMCASMLYQLLMYVGDDCGLSAELSQHICKRLKEDFDRRDTGFFNLLGRMLHGGLGEEERLKRCILDLLQIGWGGELLLPVDKKSLWWGVFDVLKEEHFKVATDGQTAFASFLGSFIPMYADEKEWKRLINSLSQVDKNRDTARVREIRNVFKQLLQEAGLIFYLPD